MRTACRTQREFGNHVPRRAITRKVFRLPSWWLALCPGQPAAFWLKVERLREDYKVSRQDRDGITYIVGMLAPSRRKEFHHEQRHQADH